MHKRAVYSIKVLNNESLQHFSQSFTFYKEAVAFELKYYKFCESELQASI